MPVKVQKERRTRGHVFVVMLGYLIVQELKKLWAGVDITVRDGIKELTAITADQIKAGSISLLSTNSGASGFGSKTSFACRSFVTRGTTLSWSKRSH